MDRSIMKDVIEQPRQGQVGPSRVSIILTAGETGGALGLVEIVSPPQSGPPRHRHQNEDEAISVVEGEIEAWTPEGTRRLGPGEAIFVPRGTEHAFRVLGDRPARLLVVVTPGGFEGYFQGLLAAGFEMPRDREAANALGERFGQSVTGGPL